MVASTSHNPMGLHGLIQGYLYLLFIYVLGSYLIAHMIGLLLYLRQYLHISFLRYGKEFVNRSLEKKLEEVIFFYCPSIWL
jgi:hypothetical protein